MRKGSERTGKGVGERRGRTSSHITPPLKNRVHAIVKVQASYELSQREHQLYLKPNKCFFEVKEVTYLGLIVGNGQVWTDPKKIAAVQDWAVPTNKTVTTMLSLIFSFL